MKLDPKDERALETTLSELREIHGRDLLAVALHGEAATADYRPRRSPLSLVVVLSAVTPAALEAMHGHLRRWRRRRVSAPLVLDPAYIAASVDVFALEFLDLMERHRVLHGDADPLAELPIDTAHLRMEVEEQLRGKMLHLWEAYLHSRGSKRAVRALLLETPTDFEVAIRGLLRLHGDPCPDETEPLLATVERAFELRLPVFHQLEDVRHGRARLHRNELARVFADYLAEVRALVRAADSL